MQIARPVMQRGSSAPGLLLPSGTPASQPEPLCVVGDVGVVCFGLVGVGVGVLGCVDGFDVGFVVGSVCADDVLDCADDDVDAAELLLGADAELLVGAEVGVGAGALVLGALDVVPTPAACCTASVVFPLASPEFDEHPVMASATAPATAMKAPPFPAPEVLMPLSTPGTRVPLRRRVGKTYLLSKPPLGTVPGYY